MYSNTSINAGPGDMNARTSRAREAGELLFNYGRSDSNQTDSLVSTQGRSNSFNTNSHNSRGYGAISYDELPENDQLCCGPMSPVRRTFCLIVTFDLIGSFIFYIIYTRVLSFSTEDYKDEVLHYTIKTSLFDTVLCSAWRFAPLLLAYALFRLNHPWPVAVTTFVTCTYVIAKVFLFQWSPPAHDKDAINHNNVICYSLLIVSFVIAWVETWFLDFQVLPKEHRARKARLLQQLSTERSHLIDSADHRFPYDRGDVFASLPESPLGSDDESRPQFHSVTNSRYHSRQHSHGSSAAVSLGGQEQDYLQKAESCWDRAWEIYKDPHGWKAEKGTNLEDGKVTSKIYPKMGKVYRLEAYVRCTQQQLFDELVMGVEQAPKWNPTVAESRVIQRVDDITDIQYTVAAESAGGLVSSRDFVNLRHWKSKDGVILASGCSVEHSDHPPTNKHVRGHNRPGGWFFREVPGDKHRSMFIWIMNTDIKGWIPQWTVDQALSGTLLSFLRHLQSRMVAKNSRCQKNSS